MLGSRNAFEALFEDGDVLSSRRHGVANLVREVWTIGTAKESLMAPHFFDGTYNTLESYIVEGGLWLVDFFAAAPRRHNCQEQPECMHYPAIPVVDVADGFSKKKFIEEFMSCNQPVLIQNATAEWPANREWTEESGKNTRAKHVRPATAAIQEKYGTSEVEVEDAPNGDRSASNSGGGNDKTNNYVEGINYGYERPRRRILLADYEVASGLYIKDWHFHANYPEDAAQLCPLPTFFSDDWLNNYATSAEKTSFSSISDYRFVYFGRAGTRTHLHSDVLGSFSWSTNICGQKRWRFLCPELTYLLRDVFGRALAPEFIGSGLEIDQDGHDRPSASLSAPEPNLTLRDSLWRFPLLTAASPWVIELRQGVGDAIFVPSEWHHTVMNEADTLSVNQNWFNRYNLHLVAARLRRAWIWRRRWSLPSCLAEIAVGVVPDSGSSDAAAEASQHQEGKPPFDTADFLRLLYWKQDCALKQLHAGDAELLSHNQSIDSSEAERDLVAIRETASYMAKDKNSSSSIRSKAREVAERYKPQHHD